MASVHWVALGRVCGICQQPARKTVLAPQACNARLLGLQRCWRMGPCQMLHVQRPAPGRLHTCGCVCTWRWRWRPVLQVAEQILAQHRAANGGAYPETVAVNLWGLDAIKTKVQRSACMHDVMRACVLGLAVPTGQWRSERVQRRCMCAVAVAAAAAPG